MADYVIEAALREKTGRNEARRLRRAGRLPGVIYGGGKPELAVSFDARTLGKLLHEEHFHATMIDIKVEGKRGKETAILKDVQHDPLTDQPIHLDFQRVRASDRIHISVPVVAVNHEKCPGVVRGGVLDIIRHELEVVCRADAIPEHIEVDCANLDIGDVVHVEDLDLPEGVEVPHEVNFTVLTIAAPTVSEAEEAEMEGGEADEGEAEEGGES